MNASPKSGRRGPRIVLALFLGAAAAAGVYMYVSSVQQTAQQSARVAAQQAVAATLADVQGKALTVPVAAGQQILTPFLANADQPDIKKFADLVPAGKRAMS